LLTNARAVAQARAQAKLAQQLALENEPEVEPERWPTREEIEQKRQAQALPEQTAEAEEIEEAVSEEEEENINAAYRQPLEDTSPYGNSHGGSPFSGGPPPKRRKV